MQNDVSAMGKILGNEASTYHDYKENKTFL